MIDQLGNEKSYTNMFLTGHLQILKLKPCGFLLLIDIVLTIKSLLTEIKMSIDEKNAKWLELETFFTHEQQQMFKKCHLKH